MGTARRAPVRSAEFPVVGVGASAGGISALQTLFKAIPAHPDLAFIVVQHLLPHQPSQLAALISKWVSLPVREAKDGMKLERGCIFVAPPGQALTLEGGAFVTRPLGSAGARAGIDIIDWLFDSLAQDVGSRAVAVVLSGTGTDGTAGAVRIKQAGGMVLVQNPTTAMHDGMPTAAIASGAADHIMPLAVMAQELVACAAPGYVRSASSSSWTEDVTKALDGIIELIRKKAGFDLAGYKTPPLLWRIQRRMELRRVPLFHDYESLLEDDPAELEALIRGIPIHVTDFFRDAPVWEALQRDVIPRLFSEAAGGAVRAWTPACATGEEAYSLAMLLAEHASTVARPCEFQVFATDASTEIVARASRGVFKPAAVNALSPERRQRFFYAVDGACRVKRALREKMVFAPQDLLADPPLSGIDLITCRNLLIYLEPEAVARVVYLLHSALRMGGYLLLGKGESLPPRQKGFQELVAGSHIYRKVGRAQQVNFAFPKRPARLTTSRSSRGAVEAHAHEVALDKGDLPAVLVDDQFQMVRIYGDTSPFLRVRAGEPTLNVLKLLGPAIGTQLEAAAPRAIAQQRAVTIGRLADPATGELTLSMRLTALRPEGEAGSQILVSFLRSPGAGPGLPSDGGDAAPRSASHAAEAMEWSEALRLSHEELEASREELQALNQELRASNDQLNLTNDELNAANERLKSKIQELETQSDVLSSGAVITLFLDEELRVNWFTPAVSALFPLKSGDTGRRITEIAPTFHDPGFLDEVRTVMRTGAPREGEVRSAEGRWYLKRIRPFRTEIGTGSGVAIMFADITDRHCVEQKLRQSEAALRESEQILRRNEIWLAAQKDAFKSAMNGAPLETSLDILIRTAVEQADSERRCAFYIADEKGSGLFQVVGMPESYAQRTNGWSFPVETSAGKLVGSFAMYFKEPHEPTPRDRELAATLTQTAAIIISRYQETEERARIAQEAVRSQSALAADLAGMKRLYDLHAQIATETDLRVALDKILAAACDFTRTDRGCIQLVSDDGERLEIFAHRGHADAASPCISHLYEEGPAQDRDVARAERRRVLIEDTRTSPGIAGTPAGAAALADGILAAQFTPMVSRKGERVGVLSTQFRQPHRPTEDELRLIDMLAWTGADFVERHRVANALRKSEDRLQRAMETDAVGVLFFDHDGVLIGANDVFLKMSGWSRRDIEQRTLDWRRMTPPEWLAESEAQMKRLAETGRIGPYEKEYFRKDGSRTWMLFAGRDLGDGTIVEFAIDDSVRKRVEAALKKSEAPARRLSKRAHQA